MGFKKYDGSTWQSITPKQLKGIPYTGVLPATLTGTKAGYLHRYKIYGNTEQIGTPTPENPIEPSECGERTENLFDFNRQRSDTFVLDSTKYIYGARADVPTPYSQPIQEFAYNNDNFTVLSTAGPGIGFLVEVKPNTTYTMSFQCDVNVPTSRTSVVINTVTFDGNFGSFFGVYGNDKISTFTTNADTAYVYLVFRLINTRITYSDIMLVEGSTAPSSYIPYGYNLFLTSAGQNVDIYLGESQTTRRIKKLVLTGEETWGYNSGNHTAYLTVLDSFLGEGVSVVSTHYTAVSNKTAYSQLSDGQCCLRESGNYLWIRDNDYSTVEDFKTWLASEYANGTPVTVWYVLATEETCTLNEPLRKIGNYADYIDSTQTSAQIPTSANSTTISWAGQGLAPSEFDSVQEWVDIPTYTYTNGAWVLKKWSYIKALVNAGVHQQYFQLGDQLTCTRGNNTIVWDIVDMTATDMTLLMHDCPFNLQYDSVEAMFAFDGGLAAGTYHFTIINQPWYAGDVGKVVQFTLTEPIPAGGQLVVQNNSSATMIGAKINSYASGSSDTVIESATMSEGSDGTDLGSLTDAGDPTNGINSVQRGLRGNSRWSTSAIRQFLNSDGAEGSVWTPQTPFDRLPSWASSQAGFKNGLEADFLSAITPNTNTTVLNTVSDGGGVETTTDMFYLPSRTEIYGTNEISGSPEGSQYDYYIGTDNDAKIKRWNNSAVNWWLRTSISSSANLVRVVNTSGAATNYNALNTIRVAAACVIRAENA